MSNLPVLLNALSTELRLSIWHEVFSSKDALVSQRPEGNFSIKCPSHGSSSNTLCHIELGKPLPARTREILEALTSNAMLRLQLQDLIRLPKTITENIRTASFSVDFQFAPRNPLGPAKIRCLLSWPNLQRLEIAAPHRSSFPLWGRIQRALIPLIHFQKRFELVVVLRGEPNNSLYTIYQGRITVTSQASDMALANSLSLGMARRLLVCRGNYASEVVEQRVVARHFVDIYGDHSLSKQIRDILKKED